MRPVPLLTAMLLLAPLLASASAVAQTRDGAGLTLALDPPAGETLPGGNLTTTLFLTNPGATAITVDLRAKSATANVTLAQPGARIPPGETVAVRALIRVPPRTEPGESNVTFLAQRAGATAADAPSVEIAYALRILAPGAPTSAPAPLARPIELAPEGARLLRVAPGAQTEATILVRNLGETREHVALTLVLPDHLTGELVPPDVTVPALGTARVRVLLSAAPDAPLDSAADVRIAAPRVPPAILRVVVEAPPAPSDLAAVTSAPRDPDGAAIAALTVGVIGSAAAGIALVRRKWPWLFAALYTRLAPSRMMDHPLRETIMREIQQEPGITFSDLARRTGAAHGMVTHHTRMLEQARLVFSTPDGQRRRFYPVAHGRVERSDDLATRARTSLREEGPATLADLARRLQVSKQALHYHVKKMQTHGMVAIDAQGRLLASADAAPPR